MWVRSQDRKKLKEIHDVDIYHDTQIWGGCSFLGQYSTKEKAMEVLNDIYFRIKYADIDEVLVYEMPADDEVEV